MSNISDHLRTLRGRANLSMEEMAERLKFKRASSYQYYESPTGFGRDRLPRHMIENLKTGIVGLGDPPITDADIDAINSDIPPQGGAANSPARTADLKLVGAHQDAVRLLLQQSYGLAFTKVAAFNLTSEADTKQLALRKPSKRYDYLPSSWVSDIANTGSLVLVRQAGAQMEPTIGDGDQMLIDWTVNRITFPGIYLLSYDGELIVGRCQRDPTTKGFVVTMDAPNYQPLRIPPNEEAPVVGRVVWTGRRL